MPTTSLFRRLRLRLVVISLLASLGVLGACSMVPAPDRAHESHGALFVGGGGRLPAEVFDAFADASGAREGLLVVIPTASRRADEQAGRASILEAWMDRGFGEIRLLHTRDRVVADSEEFVAVLDSADAVWIGGGDQNRLAEAYRGTRTQARLLEFLADGGVIGGSSAGAAIVSDPMIGGGREEPRIVGGLGLWPGTIVDQHFSQRGRFHRLRLAVHENPASFGIGVDERTAVMVQGDRIEVLGDGRVAILTRTDRGGADHPGEVLTVDWLEAGDSRRLR